VTTIQIEPEAWAERLGEFCTRHAGENVDLEVYGAATEPVHGCLCSVEVGGAAMSLVLTDDDRHLMVRRIELPERVLFHEHETDSLEIESADGVHTVIRCRGLDEALPEGPPPPRMLEAPPAPKMLKP
jgi:hypothetical protein